MTKKRWFRFYIDAWLNGTFGLTPNEIAAYVTILCELYDHDGFSKPDMDLLARRCGMRPTSFRKALDVLVKRGKLTLEGDFVTSKAVSEEIKSREKLGDKSVESRMKRIEKDNEIKEIRAKLPSNIEYRKENKKTLDIVPVSKAQGSGGDASRPDPNKSSAIEGFLKRKAIYARAK
jgi:uncharacterized protein YdaU (DUF1376 family)